VGTFQRTFSEALAICCSWETNVEIVEKNSWGNPPKNFRWSTGHLFAENCRKLGDKCGDSGEKQFEEPEKQMLKELGEPEKNRYTVPSAPANTPFLNHT